MSIKQGDLDSLCGVYSIVNAFNNLCHLDKKEREDLFKHLIIALEEEKRIAGAIYGGTTKWEIELLIKTAVQYAKEKHNKVVGVVHLFKSGRRVGLETYWSGLKSFFNDYEKCVAIVGMVGILDHWACAKKITSKTMIMDDSVGVKYIRKSKSKMDQNYNENYYNFTATQTWGLYLL
jgi:hypothetical protein